MIKSRTLWEKIGEIEENHQLPEVNPFDPEYPSWGNENRSINLLKKNDGGYIVFTDGYAVEGNNVEFFIETNEEIDDFDGSWQKNLVYETGRSMVYIDDLDEVLSERPHLVLQLDMDGAPSEWSLENPNGNIGLFISIADFNEFKSDFKLLNIKLMRPNELQYAIDNGEQGREKLAKLYEKQGVKHISSMTRISVL